MQITIRNTLGVDRLDATVAPILLLTGPNGAGKSSTMLGLASALTGIAMPCGIAKKDAGQLIRDGADAARVVITSKQGSAGVRWPEAERRTEGTAPKASPTAAGLESLLDLKDVRDRSRELDRLLKAAPSRADLAAALRDTEGNFLDGKGIASQEEADAMQPLGLDPLEQRDAAIYRVVSSVWPEIEINGFDGAHDRAKTKGAELKGAWRQVTGEVYGSDKGAKWRASGYDTAEELTPAGKDMLATLADQLTHVTSVAAAAEKNFALLQADRDGSIALAAKVPALNDAWAATKKVADAKDAAHSALIASRPGLIDVPMQCPHCSAAVALEDGKLVAVSHAASAEDIAAARQEHDDHAIKEVAAKTEFQAAYQAERDAAEELRIAKLAAAKLNGNEAGAIPHTTQEMVDAGKADVARYTLGLEAVKKTAEATRLHKQIAVNQHIIDVLAPEGLRRKKLALVLDAFNETQMAPLCQAAGYPLVTIGGDMEIRLGRRLAREPFVSEAQVMRARIILQAATAKLDGSDMILIDRVDKLDATGRNGLFTLLKLLASDGLLAVVAMTASVPKTVPDLARAQLGASVWISNGIAVPLAEALAEQAQAKAAE